MKVRLTHIDGKLPNLALMKLSHWHKSKGDEVFFSKHLSKMMHEPDYDIVYGSCIFGFSNKRLEHFQSQFPGAIVGGTGTSKISNTVEQLIGTEYEHYDYSIYPDFPYSIGFTQRGCRLNCGFCVVPKKEGRPRRVNTIYDIWRQGTPKCVQLLDNDFFGQPQDEWLTRIEEIHDGGFKVCFNQGINIRLINDDSAHWLSRIKYYDDQFKKRRLYTAWDNLRDEKMFFDGIDCLERNGVPPHHVMAYMLIGYAPDETMDRILYRFNRMVERGVLPYPMVYNNANPELKRFQRYVVRHYYKIIPWSEYSKSARNEWDNRNKGVGQMELMETTN